MGKNKTLDTQEIGRYNLALELNDDVYEIVLYDGKAVIEVEEPIFDYQEAVITFTEKVKLTTREVIVESLK